MVTRYTANKKINFCLSFTLFFVSFCFARKMKYFVETKTKKETFNESMNLFVCLFVCNEGNEIQQKKKKTKTKKIDNFKHSTISRREPATFESIRMIIIRVMKCKRRQEKDEN